MRILITGGNGSIAQAIEKVLLASVEQHYIVAPTRDELDISDEITACNYIHNFKPDVLINCAGFILPETIVQSETDFFVQHFHTNVFAPYWCSKTAINANRDVIIINIGSTSAFEGREEWGGYCASKAALLSLTETIAREGTKCYSLNPARTDTKMRERLFPNEDKTVLMTPEHLASFVPRLLKEEFLSGSHLIVKKDHYYVLPMRKCP